MSKRIEDKPQDHEQGPASAPYTLVEYGDYQCPSCKQVLPLIKKLEKHFGDKLRFIFRNFPLEQHEFAEMAAEAAEFAADHGKLWEMHDLLFKQQDHFSEELFPKLASQLGLDPAALTKAPTLVNTPPRSKPTSPAAKRQASRPLQPSTSMEPRPRPLTSTHSWPRSNNNLNFRRISSSPSF